MPETCANIKTVLEDLQGKGLSSTAKLAAILEACGITDREEVEALIECGSSTLRAARQSLKNERQNSSAAPENERQKTSTARIQAPENERSARIQAQTLENERQNSSAPSCAHATKESLRDNSYLVSLDSPLTPQAQPEASATVVQMPTRKSSPTRGSRLNREWQLPDDWRMWARTNYPAASPEHIDDQAAQFYDYWIAKPGAQACKLDWEATWRNWCRRGLSALGNVRKPQSTGVYRQIDTQGRPMKTNSEILEMIAQEEAAYAAG